MFFVPSYSSVNNLELSVDLPTFFCVHVPCYSIVDFERFSTSIIETDEGVRVTGCRYIQYNSPLDVLRSAAIVHYHKVRIRDYSVTIDGFVIGVVFIIRLTVVQGVALVFFFVVSTIVVSTTIVVHSIPIFAIVDFLSGCVTHSVRCLVDI